MLRTTLVLVLATVAAAQYEITDLISDKKADAVSNVLGGGNSQQVSPPITQPYEQLAQPVAQAPAAASPMQGANPSPMGANPMATLLNGVMGGGAMAPAQQSTNLNSRQGLQSLGQESTQVVSGLVEAFMHKVKLLPGERTCLEKNIGQLTGDVMGTVGDIVIAVKALIAGNGHVAQNQAGGMVSAGLDSAMKIMSLVSMSTQLMKNCVHGDALVFLKTCAQHMVNGTYLQHEFLVNGVDIAHSLSDSIIAFEAKDFNRFGADLGISLRKILLSKATNATRLPEGLPDQVIVQRTMKGLMSGFFVSGSSMEITDAAAPDIDIRVNLHQCIAGNSEFFKELWLAAWDLIAQLSMNAEQHGLGNTARALKEQDETGQPKWQGELMVAMMQVPMALSKCGVNGDMQSMLMEAIRTLPAIHMQMHIPEDRFKASEVAEKMAKAVEAWTQWDFEGFGYELGKLFRELVMLAFPQKYSVDASGILRRELPVPDKAFSATGSLTIVAGAAASMLVAFAGVRVRRSFPSVSHEQNVPLTDVEDGDWNVE